MTLLKSLATSLSSCRLLIIILITIGSSLFASFTQAQNEGRWYNVEILIFKRLGSAAQAQELWRNDLSLSYPDFYQYLRTPKSNPKSQLSLLTDDLYILKRYRDALRRSENFQVLKHLAWSQQMQSERDSPAIIISGGKEIGDRKELEGYIKIHVARFLHVTSNLWLTDDSTNNFNTDIQWPSLPDRPGRKKTEPTQTTNNDILGTPFNTEQSSPYPIVTLQNKRRMRSNELHYIDHPLIGMMVFMTPIDDK